MKPSFLAVITPISSGAHPDQGLPKPQPPTGSPPRPDHTLPGDLPHPSHPIFYPLPPGAPVDPEYGIPEDGPHPDQGLPKPPPRPDQGLPGPQPHPEHPIVLPPDSGGWLPIYIWGPNDPRPTPPIALPPDGEEPEGKIEWRAMWSPANGWQTVGVVLPDAPMPTPSRRK